MSSHVTDLGCALVFFAILAAIILRMEFGT